MLTANDILSCDDKRTKKLNIPQWGGDVIVSELSAEDRDLIELESNKAKLTGKADNANARLVACCLVDEGGKKLFSEDKLKALGTRSLSAMNLVLKTALELNNLTEAALEELAKN